MRTGEDEPEKLSPAQVEEHLRGIYTNEDGSMPDFSSLEKPPTSWRVKALWGGAVLFLLALITWAGFFFFVQRGTGVDGTPLALEISLDPERVVSGTPTRVTIAYSNPTGTPLASLSLRVNLPRSFEKISTLPEPTGSGNTWDVGALPTHSDGRIELTGIFTAEIPSKTTVQVFASYRPANFSSDFDKIETKEVVFEDSALALNLEMPQTAVSGEIVQMKTRLQNTSAHTLKELRVVPSIPEGFLVSKTDPVIEDGGWKLPELIGQSEKVFTLEGTFSASSVGVYDLGAQAELKSDGGYVTQTREQKPVEVSGGWLNLSLFANGSNKNQAVAPGEVLAFSLPYENTSGTNLSGLSATLTVSGNRKNIPLHWDSEETFLAGGLRSGNSVTWNDGAVEAWRVLEKGAKGVLDFGILILPDINPATHADVLTFTVQISGKRGKESFALSGTPLTVRLGSAWEAFSSGRYYGEDGVAVGSGPMPPKVGEITEYELLWSLQSSLHELTEVEVEAALPEGVEWKNSATTSAGSMSFDAATRRVRWNIGRVSQSASARFRVALTPTAEQKGQAAPLLLSGTAKAKDATTGSMEETSLEGVTTDLSDDAFADGKGVVVE